MMTEHTPVNDLTVTIGRGVTIVPLGGEGFLYAAFMDKGCPLAALEGRNAQR